MGFKRWLIATVVAVMPLVTQAYSRVVVFGDSLSDGGNNALLLGTDPGQVITGNTYMAALPYASGTYSDGDVWAGYFAASAGVSLAPSLAGGTNYAYGGALTHGDSSVSLLSQVRQYLSTSPTGTDDTLFVLAGGGNDARTALESIAAGAPPLRTMVQTAGQYARDVGWMVDSLQAAGARNIVVWNTPDVGLAPVVRAEGSAAIGLGEVLSGLMNAQLAERLASEASVRTFDVAALLESAAADPSRFGLVNVTDACGAAVSMCDPATALFWDGIHTTSAANRMLAAEMLAFVGAPVPEPATVWLYVAGVAVLVLRCRCSAARPPFAGGAAGSCAC